MQISLTFSSAWQQLKSHKITCEEAVKLLVDDQAIVNLDLLDSEVNLRFFREVPNRQSLPPLIPLLLWRNCYYLGSPVALKEEEIKKISDHTLTSIKIIPIAEKSYRAWYLTQTFNANSISANSLVNPLTGETEPEDITATTELCLSRAADQIGRVKTIISGALRNRASDIHLEPMPEGLRVRYRIDGVLRNITTLPLDVSRKVVVTLKVMSEMDISESRRPQDGRIGEKYAADTLSDVGLDMRVSTLPCVGGEKIVIRLLPSRNPYTDMNKLGFFPSSLDTYTRLLSQPHVMIIIIGLYGLVKTRTFYTILQ